MTLSKSMQTKRSPKMAAASALNMEIRRKHCGLSAGQVGIRTDSKSPGGAMMSISWSMPAGVFVTQAIRCGIARFRRTMSAQMFTWCAEYAARAFGWLQSQVRTVSTLGGIRCDRRQQRGVRLQFSQDAAQQRCDRRGGRVRVCNLGACKRAENIRLG